MRTLAALLTIAGCVSHPTAVRCQISDGAKPPEVIVATINGAPIMESELERILGNRLLKLRADEYNLKKSVLEEHLNELLVKLEASKRKVSVDEMLVEEVYNKISPVQSIEASAVYENNKERYAKLEKSDALSVITEMIRQQRIARRRAELIAELRRNNQLSILLQPPRASVDLAHGPSTGPLEAPITIVEFSEFQCPFCAQVQSTIHRLEDRYPGKIRLFFRHFPLPMHQDATKAAEAALCANEQNRFWEMHDKLFANQNRLATQDLEVYATQLGLDPQVFNNCLASGKQAKNWREDKNKGSLSGVTSTPTFFINGRLVIGAQSLETFTAIIEEELQIAKRAEVRP